MDSRDMMIYFIVNNTARTGKSRAIWLEMKELLENRSIEYKAYQTKYAGHATELARKISSLPEDRIYLITVGGDGTLNEVINGISDFSRIVLGILPIGSGNDFARGMGISRDTLYCKCSAIDISVPMMNSFASDSAAKFIIPEVEPT